MSGRNNLPNGRLLLESLMLTPERFQSGSKVAVPIPILRMLLVAAVSTLPFDEAFYLATYPDIKDAFLAEKVSDLQLHFIEVGYFEGRFGTQPDVDEAFYKETYPDVAAAIAQGQLGSARDHYMRAGVFEGRFANLADMRATRIWLELLGRK